MVWKTWFRDDNAVARLGDHDLVDSATCSFFLQLLGKRSEDERLLANSRQLYGQSLCALQNALNHRTEWRTPETLWATVLLCMFEVRLCRTLVKPEICADDSKKLFAGTVATDSWMMHAAGAIKLIKARGPKMETEWEKTIVLSFRPLIVRGQHASSTALTVSTELYLPGHA
jgi:hypothetical protein